MENTEESKAEDSKAMDNTKEPKAKGRKAEVPNPRKITTRAVRSQKNAEKELAKIDKDTERLNKHKVELTVAGGANKKSRCL
jgi:hypothetical protein